MGYPSVKNWGFKVNLKRFRKHREVNKSTLSSRQLGLSFMNGHETPVLCQALGKRDPQSCSLAPTAQWGRQTQDRGPPLMARGVMEERSDDFLQGLAGPFISSHLRGAPFAVEGS